MPMMGRTGWNVALLGAFLISGCIESKTYKPIIPPPPTVPQPRLPQNNAYTGSIHSPRPGALQPRFTWTAAITEEADPIVYELELSTSRDFSAEIITFKTQETSPQLPEALPVSMTPPVGRRYFWRVRACLPLICSDYSAVRWLNLGRSDHDYNGDGYADVLVGAPDNDDNGPNAGKAYVYFGGAGSTFDTAPDGVLKSPIGGQYFSESISSAGDFDGDGYADVLVGVPLSDAKGRAFLYFGGSGSAFEPTPDIDLREATGDLRFGASVSSAGDFNGDGFGDLVIGSPGDLAFSSPGGAVVYFGNADRMKPEGIKLSLESNPNHAGDLVALLGDLNNDGLSDISVGDASIPPNAESDCSSGLYLGRTELMPNQRPDDLLTGRLRGCKLAIKGAGDVNGDGFSDLVKAFGDSGIGSFSGANVTLSLGSAMSRFPTGEITLTSGARAIASIGDANGDGFDDFAIGRTASSVTVDLYFGAARVDSPFRPILSHMGPQGSFASTLAGIGDVNGDGLADIAIGDPALNSNQGSVSLYFGAAGAFDVNVDGALDAASPASSFGLALAMLSPSVCVRKNHI
jgi:FG-GAP-like repeat/FG-GAP repeat